MSKVFLSKMGFLLAVLFTIFSFLGRLIYPFGDEPDFQFRVALALDLDAQKWWSPFSVLQDFLTGFDLNVPCQINAGPMSLWAFIDAPCTESLENMMVRYLITILSMLPLLLLVVLRRRGLSSHLTACNVYWNERCLVFGLSFIFPSMVYYLGVFSNEQMTLIISLSIFSFWNYKFLVFLAVFVIATIDIGNAIVVALFVSMAFFFLAVKKHFGESSPFLLMIFLVILSYALGGDLLLFLKSIPLLGAKVEAVLSEMEAFGIAGKYTLLLRPVLTFMTAVFMTPSGIKIIVLYPIFAAFFIWGLYRLWKFYDDSDSVLFQDFKSDVILLCVALTTILLCVFLLPGYSNFKYYAFLTPFILKPFVRLWGALKILVFFSISNVIIFTGLILMRL